MTLCQKRLLDLCCGILDAKTTTDWNILQSRAKIILDYPDHIEGDGDNHENE